MKLLGFAAFVTLFIILGINGAYMMVSPVRWFRLPMWLRAQGGLRPETHSAGWRAVEVRLAGAITLAFVGWILYMAISSL
jgi:hypothetical protein